LSTKNKNHKHNYHDNKKEIISIVCRSIKPGYEKDYGDWLRRYLNLKRNIVCYLGTTVIIPGGRRSNMRYIIHRFSDKKSMEEWENRKNLQRC
jgi:antibiotic biosynthesis monooxygenase (ABM) superfamily enzyme